MKFLNIGYDNVSVYREAACPADNVNVYLPQFVLRIEDVTRGEKLTTKEQLTPSNAFVTADRLNNVSQY